MARYSLTSTPGTVLDNETGSFIPDLGTWQSDLYQQWLAEGNEPDSLPAPSFEDYVSRFTPGLQLWMESVAKSNAYDSVLSCVSYKDSGVAQFAGDAAAMIAWRDAVWRWASQWQAGFNGELPNPVPTLEQVMALAPQPAAYGWIVHQPGTIIESHAPGEQTA